MDSRRTHIFKAKIVNDGEISCDRYNILEIISLVGEEKLVFYLMEQF